MSASSEVRAGNRLGGPVARCGVVGLSTGEFDAGRVPVPAGDDPQRLGEPLEPDAVAAGQFVLVGERRHSVFAASIGDRHFVGPQAASRRRDIDRRVAGADHEDALADFALRERLGVRLENEIERLPDAAKILAFDAER
jgi:hypothetical protein